MVGVDDDLDAVGNEALVEMVVHRAADQGDPQRPVGHGDTIRTPEIPPSSRKSAPVVKVVGAAR